MWLWQAVSSMFVGCQGTYARSMRDLSTGSAPPGGDPQGPQRMRGLVCMYSHAATSRSRLMRRTTACLPSWHATPVEVHLFLLKAAVVRQRPSSRQLQQRSHVLSPHLPASCIH